MPDPTPTTDSVALAASEQTETVWVGIDYESDSPWAYTVVKDHDDFEPPWVVAEAPASIVERFNRARLELDAALKALMEAVGYDGQNGRMKQVCDDYLGEPYTSPINGHVSWDDCRRCAWRWEEHRIEPLPVVRTEDEA
jgi:hypothetical protein